MCFFSMCYNRHPSRDAARFFVRRYYLPSLIELALSENKKCFIDFGHQVLFSHILSALQDVIGSKRMKVVRLRRARGKTAVSYGKIKNNDKYCDDDKYHSPIYHIMALSLSVSCYFLSSISIMNS